MSRHSEVTGYTSVEDEETAWSEADSGEKLLDTNTTINRKKSAWKPKLYCNASASMLLAICAAFTILLTMECTLAYERRGSNAPRWRPAFSPVYDMMDVQTVTTFVDNSPAPNTSNPEHIYRLPPSTDVDKAWDRIAAADGVYPISSSDVHRLGKNPARAVKAPASWGFPPDKPHMMGIEGFHQLHCLNALRKALITNYDHYWGSTYGFAPPITFARHLNHCTDILRQHLLCHADLEAFTFDWRESQAKPYADFGIKKTCVNFDYVLEWMEGHRNPRHEEVWRLLEKPEGVLQKEAPPDLPQVTDETMWSTDGKYPVATILDLEGKEYCLGDQEQRSLGK